MPNGKLSDKYKGKPFGQIAKEIQSKYQDRFDPISKRGLMSEMSALKDQQEFQKAKMEAQQMLQQAMTAPQQMQQPQMGMQMQAPMMASNQGVAPQMIQEQPVGHSASQSYNEQFGYGGTMDYFDGGFTDPNDPYTNLAGYTGINVGYQGDGKLPKTVVQNNNNVNDPPKKWDGFNLIATDSNPGNVSRVNPEITNMPNKIAEISDKRNPFQATTDAAINKLKERADSRLHYMFNQRNKPKEVVPETNNPLRYAPLLANLYGIVSARKAPSTQSELAKMGFKTSLDENLGSQVVPRQTLFNNVDVSQLERGITNQARGFTGANLNVSGGNAGQFLANELGNQSNIMNAIGNARMQAQQMDQNTQRLNAGEQARIDQFLQAQSQFGAGIKQANIGIGMQMADLDARNLGAFNTNRAAQIAGLATNLGNIGKESDQMKMVANALGYNSFGEYVQSLPPEQRGNAMQGFMQMIGNMFNRG
jgi:hypothetical protein